MKHLCINQAAGIGDIIFCQKIEKIFRQSYETYWPVLPSISYISDYIINPSLGRIPPENHSFLSLDSTYTLGGSVLTAKYRFVGLDWSDWKDYVEFKRDYKKEDELYTKLIGGKTDYILLNNYVGTPPKHVQYDIPVTSKKPIINLQILDGYTVFDWCKIIENASEIYTIDTSINYITEFLSLKAEILNCYSRFKPSDFSHIEGLWKTKWSYKSWENI